MMRLQRSMLGAARASAASQVRATAVTAVRAAAATMPQGLLGTAAAPAAGIQGKSRNLAALYWKLSKGKLTVWVSISAMPGYLLAAPAALDPTVMAALACGTFFTSASAQTMNQIIEVERDGRMHRTAQRPLPTGRLSKAEATAYAAAAGGGGLGLLALGTTPATAAVAGVTMATYAAMYTPMKVLTPYNTHVGAISGALPTLMGFTAALGTGLAGSPWAAHAAWLFGMQVLWQMPHFYALAWIHRVDYKRGGYDMFPLNDKTGLATAAMSKPYLVALCGLPVVASATGLASWMLPVGCLVPSALWWHTLRQFEDKPNIATCRRFFLGSLSYLLATLGLFTAYARTEPHAVADDEAQRPGEPIWRIALVTKLAELCPHEQLKWELFGLRAASCPFGSSNSPAGTQD